MRAMLASGFEMPLVQKKDFEFRRAAEKLHQIDLSDCGGAGVERDASS